MARVPPAALRAGRLLAVVLLASSGIVCANEAGRDPSLEPRSDLSPNAPPALGTINGVKLSIPRYYLMPGLEYEGENFWEGKRRAFTPTLESPLQHFAIELRLSNLEPARTRKDQSDRIKSGKHLYETWTSVGVDKRQPVRPNLLRMVKDGWDKNGGGRGPFTRLPELEFGLAHSVSPYPVKDCRGPGCEDRGYDYYFDEGTNATFIHCQTRKVEVPPFDIYTHCSHNFYLPELRCFASASYTKNDLHRWREIEAKIQSIIHSFVVP